MSIGQIQSNPGGDQSVKFDQISAAKIYTWSHLCPSKNEGYPKIASSVMYLLM